MDYLDFFKFVITNRILNTIPLFRILFWTDWQVLHPRIESASMSGEDRRIIYNMTTKETWPNGLTLDLDTLRIYYVDARSDSIHTITYEGTDHREILRNHDLITHPFAISVFSNYLYFTDWKVNFGYSIPFIEYH